MKRTLPILILLLLSMVLHTAAGFAAAGSTLVYKGKISSVDAKNLRVTLQLSASKKQTFRITPNTKLLVNGVAVKFAVYRPGMQAQVTVSKKNGATVQIQGITRQETAVIPDLAKYRTGIVRDIEGNRVWVERVFGLMEDFTVYPSTSILKEGKRTDLTSLYPGDRVKLFMDKAKSNQLALLEIQNSSIEMKELYRGQLQSYDTMFYTITLKNVEILTDNVWKPFKSLLKLPVDVNQPAYYGPNKTAWNDMNQFTNKQVYLATVVKAGNEQAARVLIQQSFERSYAEQVSQANFNTDLFELVGSGSFTVHPGSILIRNGRLVDQYGLTDSGFAYVSAADANQGYAPLANIINIYNEGLEQPQRVRDQIYWGTLDTLVDGRLFIKDFATQEMHQWQYQYGASKELFYDLDTSIYDLTANKTVPSEEFDRQNYAVDDASSTWSGRKDWYGYMYVRDDRVVAINVKQTPDNFLNHKTTTAKVVSRNGTLLSLKEVKEWSLTKRNWQVMTSSFNSLDVSKAIIMKDGRKIAASEIQPNSNIYVIRDGGTAIFVLIT
ncbi:hypothetical protein [Paenibacillus gansuensis]|uniref:S1 motif domain-containing protein n=1 Tax=Paenibacillus gansuensis TaxID=306542 RepID=A0ABW5PK23_9BACL